MASKRDGGLTALFREHLKGVDFQSIETATTGQGVPDLNYCVKALQDWRHTGREGWVEFKQTDSYSIHVDPKQAAWLERRARHGGRVMLAIRRHAPADMPGGPYDELWLFQDQFRDLITKNIDECFPLDNWEGGPKNWDWDEIRRYL